MVMDVEAGAEAGRDLRRGGTARRLAAFAFAFALLAGNAGAASAATPVAEPGAPAPAEAENALEAASAALDAEAGAPPGTRRGATVALRDLVLALPGLDEADRREARRILTRPTDSPDPAGNSYSVPQAPPLCSMHFCIHYVATSGDAPSLVDAAPANGIPDYVEAVSAAAETSYAVENGSLGWPPARSDGTLGNPSPSTPSGLLDIYIANIGADGIYGYTAVDPPPLQRCRRSCFAYMVVDDDYSPTEFGDPNPLALMQVTLAHEYNHALQFGIDSIQDGWLLESSAVWAEERVFPDGNDYLHYLPGFAGTPGIPITDFAGANGLRVYGAGVFQHWLDRGPANYGPGVVLGAWLASTLTSPPDYAVGAVDRAIRDRGGRGFAKEFSEFAAASAEWRTAGNFPDALAYPDVRRKGRLGKRIKRFQLDHTAYRLFKVPTRPRARLRLRVRAERKTRTGIALVARDDETATVTTAHRLLKRGGRGSVSIASPGNYERITAAVTNADGRVRGFAGIDWNYTRDDRKFFARVTG
jgi:hypothetical protein